MIGQCGLCGGWHTNPHSCPASQPLTDWRDAEIARLTRERDELRGLLREARDMIARNLCHYINGAATALVKRIDAALGKEKGDA